MKINKEKTKTEDMIDKIKLRETKLEQVDSFKYLVSMISHNGKLDEIIMERTENAGILLNVPKKKP